MPTYPSMEILDLTYCFKLKTIFFTSAFTSLRKLSYAKLKSYEWLSMKFSTHRDKQILKMSIAQVLSMKIDIL